MTRTFEQGTVVRGGSRALRVERRATGVATAAHVRRDTGGAMSEENVEVLRRGLAAWNAGDMDGVRDLCAPDIVMRPPEGWPESGPFVGIHAVMRRWQEQRDVWKADHIEPISGWDHDEALEAVGL